ncbi:MAG: 50S ribosomal protein L25/general stress protein Ctc [Magnetospirillum sp.]|nr:50S ribosomal protein L25/general stress protein Ctc [Magnetospirillum sp.]
MSDISAIAATPRDRAGKGAARATRRAGLVPGVIYGGKQTPLCIALDPRVVWAELKKPGFTTRLLDIDLGASGKHRCLARDVQFHPVTDQPIHVDFMRVSSDMVVHVKVPVHCINQDKSPGIKRGGVLNIEHHEIEVACAPDAIPGEFVVDLTGLDIGNAVHLSHLALPAGVKPYHLAEEATVVSIAPPTVARAEGEAAAG